MKIHQANKFYTRVNSQRRSLRETASLQHQHCLCGWRWRFADASSKLAHRGFDWMSIQQSHEVEKQRLPVIKKSSVWNFQKVQEEKKCSVKLIQVKQIYHKSTITSSFQGWMLIEEPWISNINLAWNSPFLLQTATSRTIKDLLLMTPNNSRYSQRSCRVQLTTCSHRKSFIQQTGCTSRPILGYSSHFGLSYDADKCHNTPDVRRTCYWAEAARLCWVSKKCKHGSYLANAVCYMDILVRSLWNIALLIIMGVSCAQCWAVIEWLMWLVIPLV